MIKQLQKFGVWLVSSPLNMFIGSFLWTVLIFTLSQLILHPVEFVSDPWDHGGLRICISMTLPASFIAATFVYWHSKLRKD